MNALSATYAPISCEFHDLLEIHAMAGQAVPLFFRDAQGALQVHRSRIADLFSRDGAEFLSTASGLSIRLDQLVAVDGVRLASFCTA